MNLHDTFEVNSAAKSLQCGIKIECKDNGAFYLRQHGDRELAELSFQAHRGYGTESLHIRHGLPIEERQSWQRYLVPAVPVLRSERHVYDE